MKPLTLGALTLASATLIVASWRQWVPISTSEAFGFITGALCVWLAVKEHLWNWPVGIASSLFFVVLFWHTRLFADMALQWVYVVLGALGWYWWLHGGRNRARLSVSRTSPVTALILSVAVVIGTAGMTNYLRFVHDSAPFWDALTTALSLAAQYLLTKKLIENWYVWLAADAIYIGLYCYKHLILTAGLYGLFVVLCFAGLRQWRLSLRRTVPAIETPVEVAHG